jgi:hypothetical protein
MNTDQARISLIAAALRQGRWTSEADWIIAAAVDRLIACIGAAQDTLEENEVRLAARALNDNLRYRLTCDLAKAWRSRDGRFDLALSKRYAQALINSGGLDDAEEFIAGALHRARRLPPSDADDRRREIIELLGLNARIGKDRFVRAQEIGDRTDPAIRALLDDAVARYDEALREDPSNPWLGINRVALHLRRARDTGTSSPPAIIDEARSIIALLRPPLDDEARADADPDAPWAIATVSEAHLALGDACSDAQAWLGRLLRHPSTTAFQLASYARQLREIWQGDAFRPDDDCASRLATRLLEHQHRTTGTITVNAAQINDLQQIDTPYERVFSNETELDFTRIARICESIGCVCTETGMRFGTGFLVARRTLWPDAAGQPEELVFVTNAHVVSESVEGALRPGRARISFTTEAIASRQPGRQYTVAEVLFSSKPGRLGAVIGSYDDLDITVMRLDERPPRADGLALHHSLIARSTSAYVIGHPNGRDLQISTKNSQIIDVDYLPRLFHYRTATEPGSSGSPVFNDEWEVIGIHHAGHDIAPKLDGSGVYPANEGITLDALCKRLANAVPPPPPNATAMAVAAL